MGLHVPRPHAAPARGAAGDAVGLDRALEAVRAAGWMTFLPLPQSLFATVDLGEGRIDRASEGFEAAFALGCQIGDPCWEGMGARGIGLVRLARGDVPGAVEWLDDARTRCVRIPDAYLWISAYCLDALCETAIGHRVDGAQRWASELENLSSRTGMTELLVRAQLHRAALGLPGELQSAAVFAAAIDNPAVLHRLQAPAATAR